MATTLQFTDLKNRMLNKFGAFLIQLQLFLPLLKEKLTDPKKDIHTPLAKLSQDYPG